MAKKKDVNEKTHYGGPEEENMIPRKPQGTRRVVVGGTDFKKDETDRRDKADAPETLISDRKIHLQRDINGQYDNRPETVLYFSRAMLKWARDELGENSEFRKKVESGEFSKLGEGEVVSVEPHVFTIGTMQYIKSLEEQLFLNESRLENLLSMSSSIYECMLRYFDEIDDPDLARIEFVNIKRDAGPIAKNWEFIAEKRDDSDGVPSDGRSYKYSIRFGDNGPELALWAAPALAARMLGYGSDYRKMSDSFRKAMDAIKAGERIEKVFDPDIKDPSLIFSLNTMGEKKGRVVGEDISREVRLLEQSQKTQAARAKAFSDRQYKIVQSAFEAAMGPKKALAAMKNPKVKEALRPLEEYGENAFKYILVTDKLSRLRDALSKEGSKMDFSTVMDKLADTVTGLRAELDAYRGIDQVLGWLYENAEFYAKALDIGDGFSETPEGILGKSGGTYYEVIKVFGGRVIKVLEEAVRRCNMTGSADIVKLREEMEAIELKNMKIRDDVATISDGLRREKRFRDYMLSDNPHRHDAREHVDDMSRSLYAIFRSFDAEFRGQLPQVRLKDPEYGFTGDLVSSIKRFRRLMENMCTVFDRLGEEKMDSQEPGRYLLGPIGNVLGLDFENHQDMLAYVRDKLIPFYRQMEKKIGDYDESGASLYKGLTEGPML